MKRYVMHILNVPVICVIVLLSSMPASSRCVNGNCSDGRGTYHFINGNRYSGPFMKGKPHGTGTCLFSGGERYSGSFSRGIIHGRGTYYFANGERFTGTFANGGMLEGTYYFTNGDRYIGRFSRGRKQGRGSYYYASGYCFTGNWDDDARNGYGEMHYRGRIVRRGTWKNGRLITE